MLKCDSSQKLATYPFTRDPPCSPHLHSQLPASLPLSRAGLTSDKGHTLINLESNRLFPNNPGAKGILNWDHKAPSCQVGWMNLQWWIYSGHSKEAISAVTALHPAAPAWEQKHPCSQETGSVLQEWPFATGFEGNISTLQLDLENSFFCILPPLCLCTREPLTAYSVKCEK